LPALVTIRPWVESDFSAVRDLAAAEGWATLRDRPEEGLRAWQNAWPALVAVRQLEVIGFSRALTDGAVTLYIADLLVAPAWRRQHIGVALLEVCHHLYPTVRFDLLSTEHADAFYQVNGFRPFRGFRKNYA
jgi:GNAT superfamily N-acetyltransferase